MTIATAANLDFTTLELGDLFESPWNPRKHFDPEKLKQLADNMKAVGQLAPLIVRMKGARFEIGAGHRRYRALKLAGIPLALCRVVEMDDAQFTELLNIENLQRDDIHPLEEAQGFRDLMERAGYDVAKIAARVGRSEKYVYDRIKLLQLTPEAKKLFADGEFEAGHAILLARLSPADQTRAIGTRARNSFDASGGGGLFELEEVDGHPDEPRLKLDDRRKPRSVRELATWIDDNVRFKPEALDQFLFPETAELVTAAQEEELKVVHITHEYRIPDGAKDEKQRTYGRPSWKRATKQKCDYAVLGVVVGGPGRGEAFMVCVRKDKCKTHWAREQNEMERRRKTRARYTSQDNNGGVRDSDAGWRAKQDAERQANERARARWKKATPALLKALAVKVRELPVGPATAIGREVLHQCGVSKATSAYFAAGRSLEDLVRAAAFAVLHDEVAGYWAWEKGAQLLKVWGVDARKIVDEVAPKPANEPAKKATKKARAK